MVIKSRKLILATAFVAGTSLSALAQSCPTGGSITGSAIHSSSVFGVPTSIPTMHNLPAANAH
ncbi:MAG TPA: hypothetical protein VHY35_21290 [Stellaceae bacterium]|jgi:hypothetical protein|nr:hypothetical protein [Stellaceae bacterium]